jgi:hypothetical protein
MEIMLALRNNKKKKKEIDDNAARANPATTQAGAAVVRKGKSGAWLLRASNKAHKNRK